MFQGKLITEKQQQGEWIEFCSSLTVHHDAKTLQDWVQEQIFADPGKLNEFQDLESIAGRYSTVGVTQNGMQIYRQQLPSGSGIILIHFDGKDV